MKKAITSLTAAFLTALSVLPGNVSASQKNNPVISRNVPAYSASNPATASAGNDEHYFSFWNAQCPDYLAYDLSSVPEEKRKVIDAVWYCTSSYDTVGIYQNRNMEPSDYTIEVNPAQGGEYPESGWKIVDEVTGNTLASRQHIIDFEGYNWIRISVSKADDKEGSTAMINFDIHDVSEGVSDSWLFLGDSITAGGMNNCYGTGFATFINQLDNSYFPVQENGGIGGLTSSDGKNNIDRWLLTFPGKYVSIAYGTNDAWGNPNNTELYYNNTKYMIDAVLALGKTPVLPKIPGSTNDDVKPNVPLYNEKIEQLWEEYGDRIVRGPDFQAVMEEHPEYLSGDGVHPCSEGYEEMRRIWAETMYSSVYSAKDDTSEETDVRGDVNSDGDFNISDLVCFQNWLLSRPDSELKNWKAADLSKDDRLDAFDLIVMRRELLPRL